MKRLVQSIIAACALASASPAGAQIINGGFEDGTFGDGSVRFISPGDTALPGWTVNENPVFWYTSGYEPPNPLTLIGVEPHTGNLAINLADGSVRTVSLEQPIDLLPGQEYQVSYWVGNYSANPGPVSISVTITDGTSNTIFVGTAPATTEPSAWQQFTFPFIIRDGTSNTISFSEIGGAYYAGLDDVSIVAVPEVSTWALALLGFAGMGLVAFARGRTSAAV